MNNRALIIEDDFDLANIFAEAVKSAGYTAEVIQDGLLAKERLKNDPPDLIMLDMQQ